MSKSPKEINETALTATEGILTSRFFTITSAEWSNGTFWTITQHAASTHPLLSHAALKASKETKLQHARAAARSSSSPCLSPRRNLKILQGRKRWLGVLNE